MTFDETPPPSRTSPLVDDDLDKEESIKVTEKKNLENDIEDETLEIDRIAGPIISGDLQNLCSGGLPLRLIWTASVRTATLSAHDGPYQTNPPFLDDIISYIRNDREGQVTCTHHRQKIDVQDYQILTCEIVSTLKPLEEIIRENVFCLGDRVMNPLTAQQERKTRKDCGTRRGRHSTSSSSAFDQPSSSHLNDDDDDGNDEGTSCANTPSPTRFVISLTNEVPRVFQNPPNIDPDMEPFYTHQTEIINRQVQLRDEHRGGLRSIGKGLRKLWRNMKK
ncbi:hypothetical protein Tco_1069332 [Tanacetum coccineum]|uniref:Uncharacterized protein n=1 Tax=Tanacetum coccineum TaxID=301880 RepID=A0ABQ5HK24_9ASTR